MVGVQSLQRLVELGPYSVGARRVVFSPMKSRSRTGGTSGPDGSLGVAVARGDVEVVDPAARAAANAGSASSVVERAKAAPPRMATLLS